MNIKRKGLREGQFVSARKEKGWDSGEWGVPKWEEWPPPPMVFVKD